MTDRKESIFLRHVFRPYADKLIKLWEYALSTEMPLDEDGPAHPLAAKLFGWSSGHRANVKAQESWATASVYAYSQSLRRLIGVWTREAAGEELSISKARTAEEKKRAVERLAERGDTWTRNCETAGMQLITSFVNPEYFFPEESRLEPDGKAIHETQARGAILFGPPGTSKTTLSQFIADAIGWDFLELHASDFVADGLPNVQKTANTIFEELKELDRTVILFDEIDELVRTRTAEHDAFGRFLTTSMLPKLAELWTARKVIYFIATNHIEFFDPAITRAQRFDAVIRVPPPSFAKKLSRLQEILGKRNVTISAITVNQKHIDNAIDELGRDSSPPFDTSKGDTRLPDAYALAKFLLLRWDQLDELAAIIDHKHELRQPLSLSPEVLSEALREIRDPNLMSLGVFRAFIRSEQYEQHDFSKTRFWKIDGDVPTYVKVEHGADNGLYITDTTLEHLSRTSCSVERLQNGRIRLYDNAVPRSAGPRLLT